MKHEKRQRYARISESSGLKAYKQTYQPFTTTQRIYIPLGKIIWTFLVSKQNCITTQKRCKHHVTFNHLSSDYIIAMEPGNVL